MTNHPPPSALPDDRWAEEFADALREQRARVQEFLAALGKQQRRAEAQISAWIEQCEESGAGGRTAAARSPDPAELAALRDERDRLTQQLFQTESRLSDMAGRLADAENRLAQASQGNPEGAGRPRPAGGVLDWESEKRRILAALEAENDPGSEPSQKTRTEIEEVLRRTDLLVADKSREIAELKQLLQDQSANLGSVAVGAAALGDILDRDAIIREERENLHRLQVEWQEKLRKAEVEISIERARLARQHAEIDEKLRTQGGAHSKPDAPGSAPPKPDKSSAGRWLARLGLKDPNDT